MLNGSLDTVALPDVLRLIASSGRSGLLRVDDASPSGRIFIVDGRVAFATTRNEDDPIGDLLGMEYRADYVGSVDERRVVDMNELLENNPEVFRRFLEQMVVEVLSRLLRVDDGEFRFEVDIRSPREVPHSFEVEDIIQQAATRADAWARIFEVIPSASVPFRMAPRLDEPEEVVLGRRDWALLAATGVATTITDIAHQLKIFEFAAAKKVAELVQRGLIGFVNTEVSEDSMAAVELLSEVHTTEVTEEGDAEEVPLEPDLLIEDGPAEITFLDQPEAEPAEETGESAAPTWLPIGDATDEEDPAPLIEELHRLHEAEDPAGKEVDDLVEADEASPRQAEEEEDESVDADDPDGGDLATRWKNLRKTKRGVHAANE